MGSHAKPDMLNVIYSEGNYKDVDIEEEYLLLILVSCGHAKAVENFLQTIHRVTLIPLLYAIYCGFTECTKVLLKYGANVNGRFVLSSGDSFLECTALSLAVLYNRPDCVRQLLNNGADINFRDSNNQSLICAALTCGYIGIVRILLNHGATFSMRDRDLMRERNIDVIKVVQEADYAESTEENEVICVAREGDYRKLRRLILASANVNAQDKDGFTALHILLQKGSLDCVQVLLYADVNYNLKSKEGVNVLHIAAENGYVNLMPRIIRYGTIVNEADARGTIPLHIAARNGSHRVIKVLLDSGANVNARDKEALTPLHFALASGSIDSIHLLMARGADVNIKSNLGCTPLMLAALMNKSFFEPLLPPRERINEDTGRLVALYDAATMNADCLQLVLQRGARTNVRVCDNAFTPLHLCALRGCERSVDLLLQHRADVNAKDVWGGTPLHCSSWLGKQQCTKLLILNGAHVNATMNRGWTPLHLAARGGHLQCVKILTGVGCDVHIQDEDGNTPLIRSILQDRLHCALILLEKGSSIFTTNKRFQSALSIALQKGTRFFNKFLAFIRPHIVNNKGQELTHILASENKEVLSLALAHGAAINSQDLKGCTPLHYAAKAGKHDCIKLLLENGANVNAANESGETALHLAALRNDTDCIIQLLFNQADTSVASKDGNTPLHYAAARGNEFGINYLLRSGADVNALNNNHETPVKLARRCNQEGSIRVFHQIAGSVPQWFFADSPFVNL